MSPRFRGNRYGALEAGNNVVARGFNPSGTVRFQQRQQAFSAVLGDRLESGGIQESGGKIDMTDEVVDHRPAGARFPQRIAVGMRTPLS